MVKNYWKGTQNKVVLESLPESRKSGNGWKMTWIISESLMHHWEIIDQSLIEVHELLMNSQLNVESWGNNVNNCWGDIKESMVKFFVETFNQWGIIQKILPKLLRDYWGIIEELLRYYWWIIKNSLKKHWEIIVNLFWNCELKYISRLGYAGRRPAIQFFVFIIRQNSCQ